MLSVEVPSFQAPDPGLIQRARQGDNKSIGLLFERYQQGIFRYLYYQVGERRTAEDLTMEVYMNMVRGLPSFQSQATSFQSWLLQIARNLAVEHFRQPDRSEPLIEDLWDPDLFPEATLGRLLTHTELLLALTKVNDEQREVIILRFILQMSIEDVAQLIGRSTEVVKSLQGRGLQVLYGVLSENGWWQSVIPEKSKE
jgi:RNA polymerase sigma-70 factor, ECF subfamily